MLEAEVSYDFGVTFTETFANSGSLVFQRTDMRLLHGPFGPKVSLGHSNFHLFVTAKGGFLDTMLDSRPATIG